MPGGYVTITKEVDWQGGVEEFSNVYHLDEVGSTAADGNAAVDSLVAIERAVHGTDVRFKEAKVYRFGGLAGTEGIYRETLTGTGALNTLERCYRECAVLVKFELPRSGTFGFGRFRQLMKWLHVAQLPGVIDGQFKNGIAVMNAGAVTFYRDSYATPLMTQPHGPGRLSNAAGVRPTALAIHPYLEHRQFHQGKKERP